MNEMANAMVHAKRAERASGSSSTPQSRTRSARRVVTVTARNVAPNRGRGTTTRWPTTSSTGGCSSRSPHPDREAQDTGNAVEVAVLVRVNQPSTSVGQYRTLPCMPIVMEALPSTHGVHSRVGRGVRWLRVWGARGCR